MSTYRYHYNKLTKKGADASLVKIFHGLALLFVKVTTTKVRVYEITTWGIEKDPLLTLYPSHIRIHYRPYEAKRKISDYLSNRGRFSINTVQEHDLITFSNGTKCIFYKGMKITYSGCPVSVIPEKHAAATDRILDEFKKRKNAMNRLYYHRKKAAERFSAAIRYEEWESGSRRLVRVDVSQLPMTDVFKLQNVSDRRHLITYFGLNAILAGLESEVINSDVINGNPYDLVTVSFPYSNVREVEKGTYLRMVNPSTDEIHFEGVPNYDRSLLRNRSRWERRETISSPTVRAALAWRDGETRYTVPKILT